MGWYRRDSVQVDAEDISKLHKSLPQTSMVPSLMLRYPFSDLSFGSWVVPMTSEQKRSIWRLVYRWFRVLCWHQPELCVCCPIASSRVILKETCKGKCSSGLKFEQYMLGAGFPAGCGVCVTTETHTWCYIHYSYDTQG